MHLVIVVQRYLAACILDKCHNSIDQCELCHSSLEVCLNAILYWNDYMNCDL